MSEAQSLCLSIEVCSTALLLLILLRDLVSSVHCVGHRTGIYGPGANSSFTVSNISSLLCENISSIISYTVSNVLFITSHDFMRSSYDSRLKYVDNGTHSILSNVALWQGLPRSEIGLNGKLFTAALVPWDRRNLAFL